MFSKKFFAILIVALAIGSQCNNSTAEKDHTESAVPAELKDSTVINADEDKALEQLKNVMGDSTKTK